MQESTNEELQLRIRDLEKEVARLHAQIKNQRYGLVWLDVPEGFESETENKIPILEEVKDKAIKNDDGKPTHILIEGDNYHALTCLNYTHKGKVDVIYIDPPYNTGSDGFTYKDKRILKEFPDGTPVPKDHPMRHSYWLSFMSKRLELAKNLLSDKGVIFISIDDNEQANLKLLCDKVFDEKNFLAQLILKTATDNNPSQINIEHEYMLCYSKKRTEQGNWERTSEGATKIINKYKELKGQGKDIPEIQNELRKWIRENKDVLKQVAHYNNVDEKGVYSSSSNSSNPHPGGYTYDIVHPKTKKPCPKPANGWRWPFSTFKKYDEKGEVEWGKDDTTQPHIKKRIETSTEYLRTLIYEDNRATTKALAEIFEGEKVFDNPKPRNVISRILDFASSPSSTILDFFAGSGTTMHAVMELNEDGGKRQCILVQQKENEQNICESVTYERNKRVIQGYTNSKNENVEGLGNSLKYYKTGFVGKNNSNNATDSDKVELSLKAGYLLALAENTLEELSRNDFYQIFEDGKGRITAVYFKGSMMKFGEFSREIESWLSAERKNTANVYIFCWGDVSIYENEFEDMSRISLKAIPKPILDIYKSINC